MVRGGGGAAAAAVQHANNRNKKKVGGNPTRLQTDEPSSPGGMLSDGHGSSLRSEGSVRALSKLRQSLAENLHEDTPAGGFLRRFAKVCRQKEVREAYEAHGVQLAIAGLILGNFISNIIEKEVDPFATIQGFGRIPACLTTPITLECPWFAIETVWNSIFIVELAWNFYGHFYISTLTNQFFCSGWNLFDLLVVGVSIPSMTGADLGPMSMLRMLRAFRVFRLFKRVQSLNKIIVALVRAIPGLLNSALVMVIFMCIFAILATDLFGLHGRSGHYLNTAGRNVSATTARNLNYSSEYFGTFFKSLYTLFQVLTGESWSEAVARPLIFSPQEDQQYVAPVFFIAYVCICGMVLVNVVVAVVLEKMVAPPEEVEGDSENSEIKQLQHKVESLEEMLKKVLTAVEQPQGFHYDDVTA